MGKGGAEDGGGCDATLWLEVTGNIDGLVGEEVEPEVEEGRIISGRLHLLSTRETICEEG